MQTGGGVGQTAAVHQHPALDPTSTDPTSADPGMLAPSDADALLAAFADDPSFTPARLDAAAAVRRLIHTLVAREADESVLERVAATANGLATVLAAAPRRVHRDDGDSQVTARFSAPRPDGAALFCFTDCMVAGPANPLSAGAHGHRDGDEAVLEVRLEPGFEGLPGRSHGGILASLFDEVMGYALYMDAVPAFTAWLRVDYRAPVPVEQPLEFRARVRERAGRKCFLSAVARFDGQIVAEAEALFVIPR